MTTSLPPLFTPMLASLVREPFDSPDFLFEVKWDGVRTLAYCERGKTRLFSRSQREVTHQYPEFDDLHELTGGRPVVLDGEIVAMDEAGRPSFQQMQQRIGLTRATDVRRGMGLVPLDLVLFDVLYVDEDWVTSLPLAERIELLASLVRFEGRVLQSDVVPETGVALFDAASERGLEGIVAKRSNSQYFPGKRSKDWLKIKLTYSVDCVIGGWTMGTGHRASSLGALLVGVYDGKELKYIGSVGTGFTDRVLADLYKRLLVIETDKSPFSEPMAGKTHRWVRPKLVCEVEYREVTTGLRMRAPSFKGLRTDKSPKGCVVDQLL